MLVPFAVSVAVAPEQTAVGVEVAFIVGSGLISTVNVAAVLAPQALFAVTETVPVPGLVQLTPMPVVPCPLVIEPPAPATLQV